MKKIVLMFCCFTQVMMATEYFAKANPLEEYAIKSAASGQVTRVDITKEGRVSDGAMLIMIDDKIDVAQLTASKEKVSLLESNLALSKQSVNNSYKAMQIAKKNYEKVKGLSSYTRVQKDAKLVSAINATNSYLQSKTTQQNLKTQLVDLKERIIALEDSISKKHVFVKKGHFIYKIYPRKGDFVTMGSPLLQSADISKARLSVYVTKEDLLGIEEKKIFIDGKETSYKIEKLWKMADSKNISAYRCDILIDKPELFSVLKKVEFR